MEVGTCFLVQEEVTKVTSKCHIGCVTRPCNWFGSEEVIVVWGENQHRSSIEDVG